MDMDRAYIKKPSNSITRRVLQWKPQGQRRRGNLNNTWRRGVEQAIKKMDMDRAYVKKTQQQYHKKSPPMEATMTMEKRQAQQHMEKRSEAGDKGGTSHMGHSGNNS